MGSNDSIAPNKIFFFFSKKTINIVFMYVDASFLGQKRDTVPPKKFETINVIVVYFLALFIVKNLKTILMVDPEL